MPIFTKPTYPVLDRAPGIWTTVTNFNTSDCAKIVGCTAISYPYGYWAGMNAGVPRSCAVLTSVIGAMAGYMYAYQGSSGRLMGFLPNDAQVDKALKHQ
mmetsp:Transcript_7821/g.23105  ORF Transcript_7821/g.23105 Transcript_7821/m.23105 type:complete len:99 (-) Transcript_7821:847-1143(-)